MNDILKNIREIRAKRGLSQENVAFDLEMKQNSYGLIENGKRSLSYDTLSRLAIIFKMQVIDIITWPKEYVDKDIVNSPERISVTFEISPDKKDILLNLVTGKNS